MQQVLPAALLAIYAVVFPIAAVEAAVVSTFDADADGWTQFQNTGGTLDHFAAGGNPGGHIAVTDYTGDWGYLAAPGKFLAPGAYGGSLSFDLKHLNGDGNTPVYGVRVGLQGAGFTLISEAAVPTNQWTSYLFALTEGTGWRIFGNLSQNYSDAALAPTKVQMQAILADLTGLYIAADYTNSCGLCGAVGPDRTYLDNVRIDTAAVPLPAALPLFASGLAAFGLLGWSRRRNTRGMACPASLER
jgi:hypothetical protein